VNHADRVPICTELYDLLFVPLVILIGLEATVKQAANVFERMYLVAARRTMEPRTYKTFENSEDAENCQTTNFGSKKYRTHLSNLFFMAQARAPVISELSLPAKGHLTRISISSFQNIVH
jgi:hypothetical protein